MSPSMILVWVASASLLVLGLVALAVLIQWRRTLREAQEVIGLVRSDVVPMLREWREAAERVNGLSRDVQRSVRRATAFLDVAGDAGEAIRRAQQSLEARGRGLLAGVHAAWAVITERSHRNGD